MIWKDGKRKALTLSYDDGTIHDRRFIEILKRYEIPCTFNIISGALTDEKTEVDYLETPIEEHRWIVISKDEVADVYKDHEVASHSVTHPKLTGMPLDEVNKEIADDITTLHNLTGKEIRGFAYPFGEWDEELMNRLANQGIVYARTVNATHNFKIPENFLSWHPTCHHDDEQLMALAKQFVESDEEGLLFYLWGHTYEFYINNNWNVIEQFFEYISQYKDDIWFATNIEIYDYVKANQ